MINAPDGKAKKIPTAWPRRGQPGSLNAVSNEGDDKRMWEAKKKERRAPAGTRRFAMRQTLKVDCLVACRQPRSQLEVRGHDKRSGWKTKEKPRLLGVQAAGVKTGDSKLNLRQTDKPEVRKKMPPL